MQRQVARKNKDILRLKIHNLEIVAKLMVIYRYYLHLINNQ